MVLRTRSLVCWAHPRVCGENAGWHSIPIVRMGSSPRVRGKLDQSEHEIRPVGLIPACAGKTLFLHLLPHWIWAHPRVCGENREDRPAGFLVVGSSPRVRGKH